MSKTAKFAVSMPEAEFKDIEAERRRTKKTRSEFIREAVRAWRRGEGRAGAVGAPRVAVKEDPSRYELMKAAPETLADIAELRRRAIAAAGSFRSGSSDLSVNHDKYLAEGYAVTGPAAAIADKKKSGVKP
jgi:Arc/MetJ-type ribon-helix-helix transcriptional regulator